MKTSKPKQLTILLVEDDLIDHKQVERLLESSELQIKRIWHALTMQEALDLLDQHDVDIALVDLNLPDSMGMRTVETIHDHFPTIPLVVVTGENGQELGLKAVACGAQDYMIKGEFESQSLTKTIRYAYERQKSEDAMRRERDFAESLIEMAQAIVLVLDADGKIVRLNPYMETVLGYCQADLYECHWLDVLLPPYHQKRFQEMMEITLQQTGGRRLVNQVVTKSGQERHIEWHMIALNDGNQNVTGVLATGQDITERKRAEEAMRLANEGLEKANRSLKEMHAQVIQNEKLASIGQLSAGVAHELNTPVGFVASNFESLQKYVTRMAALINQYDALRIFLKDHPDEAVQACCAEIEAAYKQDKMEFILDDIGPLFDDSREGLERVTDIVQNLRDFSRVSHSEHMEPFNLNDGVKATLTVGRNAIKYDADVEQTLGDIPPVGCIAGQINQVLLNILVNAAQAIKGQLREDRGLIKVRTFTEDGFVICEIVDNGPGIPPDKVPHVFEPFFTTKPLGKGTGLGLSVSHDIIVNKHQGRIDLDTQVGRGTTFRIALPLVRMKPKETPPQAESVSAGQTAEASSCLGWEEMD